MWFLACCTSGSFTNTGATRSFPSLKMVDLSAPVVQSLAQLWQPVIAKGHIQKQQLTSKSSPTLFKQSTLDKVDSDDLIFTAKKVRKEEEACLEIGSLLLGNEAVKAIQKQIVLTTFFPDPQVELKVRKLVVHTPDNQDRRSIDNDDSSSLWLGWVEVILNSPFTGGELQVVCDGQDTNLSTNLYSWTAVLGKDSSSVSPVTSGTRVSLIFDVIAIPTSANAMFKKGTFSCTKTNLVSDMLASALDAPKLIRIAEQLRPELVGKRTLTIDACILNARTLAILVRKVDCSGLFGNKRVSFQAKCLTIQQSSGDANHTSIENRDGNIEGYLGTLVLILGDRNRYDELNASWSRGEQHSITFPNSQTWYAFKADTTVTFKRIDYTKFYSDPIVALYYDIYSAEPFEAAHDPLSDYSSGIETPSFLTRSVVSETVRDHVQSVLEAELASSDAVIITLQHLFPEGPADSLWNTYPAHLQGGDRVLYDILTGTNTCELYSVQLVEVTLRCHYEKHLMKDVIVPEQCTFVPVSDPLVKPVKYSGPANVKLIVATKLTDRHRMRTLNRAYQVFSLYVSKKM